MSKFLNGVLHRAAGCRESRCALAHDLAVSSSTDACEGRAPFEAQPIRGRGAASGVPLGAGTSQCRPVGALDERHGWPEVGDRPASGRNHQRRRPRGPLNPAVSRARHPMLGRLEAEHAAEVTRDANRASGITPELQRRQAGGDRCGASARTPARRARGIPGIIGPAEDGTVTLPVVAEQGDIRLAEEDRAGAEDARGDRSVGGRDVVAGRG
jgi:hypothetical protein